MFIFILIWPLSMFFTLYNPCLLSHMNSLPVHARLDRLYSCFCDLWTFSVFYIKVSASVSVLVMFSWRWQFRVPGRRTSCSWSTRPWKAWSPSPTTVWPMTSTSPAPTAAPNRLLTPLLNDLLINIFRHFFNYYFKRFCRKHRHNLKPKYISIAKFRL